MSAVPPYPYPHSGALLVIGGDPGRPEDVVMARQMRPHARVMCINSAAKRFPGDFIASGHVDELAGWRADQARINPKPFTVHSAKWTRRMTNPADYPFVDHFWPGCVSEATSTFCGVRIGQKMGFTEIIVCCAPLDETFDLIHGKTQADVHRLKLAEEARTYPNVTAMSGYPRRILGAPRELVHGAV
jgi:hypothetical protein